MNTPHKPLNHYDEEAYSASMRYVSESLRPKKTAQDIASVIGRVFAMNAIAQLPSETTDDMDLPPMVQLMRMVNNIDHSIFEDKTRSELQVMTIILAEKLFTPEQFDSLLAGHRELCRLYADAHKGK